MALHGMDQHGEPVDTAGAAYQIVEDAIAAYIERGYRTCVAGMGQEQPHSHPVTQMRYLHLAEPHLPAVAAVRELRRQGLLTGQSGEPCSGDDRG